MPLFILILSVCAGDCQQGLKGTIYFHPKPRITLTGCFARVKNNTRNNFSLSFRCDRAASCKEAAGRDRGDGCFSPLPRHCEAALFRRSNPIAHLETASFLAVTLGGGRSLLYLPTLFVLYNLALSITIEFKSTATLGILVFSQ